MRSLSRPCQKQLTGRVTAGRETVVPLTVHGPGGRRVNTEATIDTGFNGYLTLSPSVVRDLELPFAGTTLATLGDARRASLDLFLAAVEWHDDRREALVLQADGAALPGMAILEGDRLTLDVVEGGAATIRPL